MSLALRRFWQLPAVQALLLQCAAFGPMLAIVYVLARNHYPLDNISVALLQGVIAGALCWWRGLAVWWRAMSFAFAPALYMGLSFELPPTPFLAAFLLMLLLYWSTFRTQVPYYPSGRRIWAQADRLLPKDRPLRIIDIGSGLGGFVLDLARRRADCEVQGIELAPLPWLVSSLRARMSGSSARFIRGDYERIDFADYDVVFAYLSPAAMEQLWRKASREMGKGAMLMSLEFTIPGHPPDLTVAGKGRDPALYVWHF